ncbi:Uu.00g021110.m01.CDS01 [Anthostomella pinea]|uniref:H/ACA ribonucleoprotein complex non-core subunit NAF1 n=1 Tax=Anthostomella pinea TaxID=933095 RepID=A0AAI8VZL4_9PEZI|nr:Uu.00g021110.m01.CDS01 [Anthostomella pinea]
MAGGFQIPGLTSLSQPAQPPQPEQPAQSTQSIPSAESVQDQASAHDTAPDMMHTSVSQDASEQKETEDSVPQIISQDTEPSGQGENGLDEAAEYMVLDQPQVVEPPAELDVTIPDAPPSPPSLTSGLEALLGGLEDAVPEQTGSSTAQPEETNGVGQVGEVHEPHDGQPPNQEGLDGAAENPEWEEDSSPYESSSDSSSSDDSDDDRSEDEKNYKVLGPEETARILMEMEGGSDDDGEGKAKGSGSGGQVRTKNELPEEVIPKPDVTITPEMKMIELGVIEHVVQSTVVIKANTTGEYQVLDTGSVLCTEDRTVIAVIADLIGSVRQPRYTARFTNDEDIKALGLELGTKIFYTQSHASPVFTQALREIKGTDASNWHDEEAGLDEMEFSDDEKEAEYKRQQKAKRRGGRGGKDGPGGRGGRNDTSSNGPAGLKYDDEDDDGPYKRLTRPAGFGQGQPPPASTEDPNGASGHGGSYRGGRGDFRGRGNRGRGRRGDRGAPRGGYSLPPRPSGTPDFQQAPMQQYNTPPVPPQFSNQAYPQPPPQFSAAPQFHAASQFSAPQNAQQAPSPQYPFSWPQNVPQGFVPPPPPQFSGQQDGNAGFYNPAFLASLQNQFQGQYGQQGQQGQQNNNQWAGHGGHGGHG